MKKNNKKIAKQTQKKNIQTSGDNKQIETLIDKTKIKNKQRKNKIRFYYSFLTIILLICLVQISFSALLNISKTISYQTKIQTIKKSKNSAATKNKQLKNEIKNFSSVASLEAIARNNLKMAGENEVLVIINDPTQAPNNDEAVTTTKSRHKHSKHFNAKKTEANE